MATKVAGCPIYIPFRVPIPVQPGEFIAIVAKHETGGTVGTAGTIAYQIAFDALHE